MKGDTIVSMTSKRQQKDFVSSLLFSFDNDPMFLFAFNGLKEKQKKYKPIFLKASKGGFFTKVENDYNCVKELKELFPNGSFHIPAKDIEISKLGFDDKHINKEREHNVTVEMAKGYIQNAKASVEDLVKNAGIKMTDFMATSAQVMANMFAQGKEKVANSFKDTKKAAAFNALLIASNALLLLSIFSQPLSYK